MSKNNMVTVRMSDEQYTNLVMKSKSANMNMAEFVRNAVRSSTVTAINQDLVEIEKAKLYLYKKASNNINQIAKHLNRQYKINGKISSDDLNKLKEELKNISDMLRGV